MAVENNAFSRSYRRTHAGLGLKICPQPQPRHSCVGIFKPSVMVFEGGAFGRYLVPEGVGVLPEWNQGSYKRGPKELPRPLPRVRTQEQLVTQRRALP